MKIAWMQRKLGKYVYRYKWLCFLLAPFPGNRRDDIYQHVYDIFIQHIINYYYYYYKLDYTGANLKRIYSQIKN